MASSSGKKCLPTSLKTLLMKIHNLFGFTRFIMTVSFIKHRKNNEQQNRNSHRTPNLTFGNTARGQLRRLLDPLATSAGVMNHDGPVNGDKVPCNFGLPTVRRGLTDTYMKIIFYGPSLVC